MATFEINKKYSANFALDKAKSGWEAAGRLYKKRKDDTQLATDIRFRVTGNTRQAAVNAAQQKAAELCPDD